MEQPELVMKFLTVLGAPPSQGLGCWRQTEKLGKSKRGLTNEGLSPKLSEKSGEIAPGKSGFSGLIRAFPVPLGAFSVPIGTNSSAPHGHGGRAEITPKAPSLAQLAPFGPSPRLLSPRLDFTEKVTRGSFNDPQHQPRIP